MENNKHNHFDRTFDIEGMLYGNAKWLAKQTGLTTTEFIEIAEQLSMGQEDWTRFWKMIREIKHESNRKEIRELIQGSMRLFDEMSEGLEEVEKILEENSKELSKAEVEVWIGEREESISEERFQALKTALGDPEEQSNCCGADVYPHNSDDHTSRCYDCGEGCGIVYIF